MVKASKDASHCPIPLKMLGRLCDRNSRQMPSSRSLPRRWHAGTSCKPRIEIAGERFVGIVSAIIIVERRGEAM